VTRFVSRFSVEWAHCDAAGIVFYPYFYTWFDQATERLFKSRGISYAAIESEFGALGMPLLETGSIYENPCRLGDELEMTSWVEEWHDKTLLVKHRIVHVDGRPALEGFERRAWVARDPGSPRGMKAITIPEAVKQRFL
jgi:4-hydroxybenzoyl-CoA thioesterase